MRPRLEWVTRVGRSMYNLDTDILLGRAMKVYMNMG